MGAFKLLCGSLNMFPELETADEDIQRLHMFHSPPCLENNAQIISRKLKKLPKYRIFAYMGKEKF
jgi:hypothetical protein